MKNEVDYFSGCILIFLEKHAMLIGLDVHSDDSNVSRGRNGHLHEHSVLGNFPAIKSIKRN